MSQGQLAILVGGGPAPGINSVIASATIRANLEGIAAKNIGYELRCADPIPFDLEYARDLGYCATKYLLEGGTAAMRRLPSAA